MSGKCHDGNPLVFDHDGVKVYAGGTNRNGGWTKMQPYPDLALGPIGVVAPATTRDVLPDGWSCSTKLHGGSMPVVMEIDWPDYSIPKNLGKDFWVALVDDIRSKGIKTVSTQCMGGHGRTGVQLCILAHLLGATKQPDAHALITWMRGNYCEHAVEAQSQQQYIADICDLPVGESAVSVRATNTWGIDPHDVVDFDDFTGLTIDELEALEREEEKTAKKNQRKAIDGVQWKKAKPKRHIDTPLIDNWTLTFCPNCQSMEWRRASPSHVDRDCQVCYDSGVVCIDRDVLDHKTMMCAATGNKYHEVEMYNSDVCNIIKAEELGYQVREDEPGMHSIKLGNKWHPSFFVMDDGEGGMTSADKHFKETHAAAIKREKGRPKKSKGKGTVNLLNYEEFTE